ncbi:hypothetical protein [Arthrobacter glacialis]|uniref:hypothetical protein n=1 Tax=Arthrobacter glacialis TaxID=1664 RepID=UPI000CD3B20C|nr:hypothetical protein [Arthrobacter glacialis]POH58935.1 hypothetical protein CVS28_09520 [Arthrobacter glacialis]
MSADTCPPFFVPTRSECNAMKEQSRSELLAAGISPERWNLDAMGCSHGDRLSDHIEDVEPTVVELMNSAALDTEYHDHWERRLSDPETETCGGWSGEPNLLNCERPRAHAGAHAAVLGMDSNANDWVRWSA